MTPSEPSGQRESATGFDAFFDRVTPIVHGYALRLCAGDRDRAADLTQDAWLTMVRDLHVHPGAVPSVGWLIRVVRSRFIDDLRRQQRLPNKLALVWSADRSRDDADDMRTGEMIDALDRVRPEHRAVLLMFYVDDLAANDVARELGISRSATYELLHHAKAELRDVVAGARRA